MKRCALSMLIGMLILCISACSGENATKESSSAEESINSLPYSSQDVTNVYASYLALFQENEEFFNVTTDEYLDIAHLKNAFTSDGDSSLPIEQFSVIDLDCDGIEELILQLSISGKYSAGFEILHIEEEKIYGYTVGPRDLMALKEDGSFGFSSSASDNGYGKISCFTPNGLEVNEEIVVRDNLYYVDHEKTTRNKYDEAVEYQQSKPNAIWYDYTEDNIFTVLSGDKQ